MRKVILYIAVSIDGFIADERGGVDWITGEDKDYDSDLGYESFYKSVDTVVMGGVTYRQITEELSPGKWVYEGKKCYVFSKSLEMGVSGVEFVC